MPYNIPQSKLNTECSIMKLNKHNWRKRFSKFFSKMFWHFNQAVPNYSTINHRSNDKHVLKSNGNSNHEQIIYPTHYRKLSLRQRTSTLTSIQEENEIELMNCI